MKSRVLIVDDEEDFLDMFVNRLLRRGYDAVGKLNAEDALEDMKKHEYDVIVLDVKMPGGMDGLEAYKKMKALQPSVQIIFLTGHGSVELCQQGLNLGAFDYLLKPAEFEELLRKIDKATLKQR
ncbi:MAG TPA: response regulator [Desulfohalobiaceae bacterium]|nr:response regulator [Desulfohalobiaceae bacterium]